MARELTQVEKNIIRAIYEEAGPQAMVTYLCELAAEANAKALADQESGVAAEVARIKAEEKASMAAEAEAIRAAKAAEISGALGGSDKVGNRASALVVGLTVREVGMVVRIAESDYTDGDPAATIWASVVCESRADSALVANLAKKGLCANYGSGHEATMRLTDKGLAAYCAARPDSSYARSNPSMCSF